MIDVLSRSSFEATTIDDFVRAAGISRGSFYNYFKSREAVAHGIATLLQAIVERRTAELDDPGASPLDRVALAAAVYLQTAALEPNITRVMFRQFLSHYPKYPTFLADTADQADALIRSGVEEGLFLVPDLDLISGIQRGALALSLVHVVEAPENEKAELCRNATVHLLLALGVSRSKAAAAAERAVDRVASASLDVVDDCIDDLVDSLIGSGSAEAAPRAAAVGTR